MDNDQKASSPSLKASLKDQRASRFTGLVLVIPGIVLYIYILYIVFSILVYPGSFTPFMGRTFLSTNGECTVSPLIHT